MSKNHDWKILYTTTDKNEVTDGYLFCANCNMSGVLFTAPWKEELLDFYHDGKSFTIIPQYDCACEEFLPEYNCSITHDWVWDCKYCPESSCYYKCIICDMAGINRNNPTPWIIADKLYTCNEWLMIRANE